MNDDSLRTLLETIQSQPPSPEFISRLGAQLDETAGRPDAPGVDAEEIAVLEVEEQPDTTATSISRQRFGIAVAVAAVLLILVGFAVVSAIGNQTVETDTPSDDDTGTTGTTAPDPMSVGQAWLKSVVDNDRTTFVSLHAADLQANNNLMGWVGPLDALSDEEAAGLYFDGFDALQASLEADDDYIQSEGCTALGSGVRCSFKASFAGPESETFSVQANLRIDRGLVTRISFIGTTDPQTLWADLDRFVAEAASDQDLACLDIAFSTISCGEHESDFLRRYKEVNQQP